MPGKHGNFLARVTIPHAHRLVEGGRGDHIGIEPDALDAHGVPVKGKQLGVGLPVPHLGSVPCESLATPKTQSCRHSLAATVDSHEGIYNRNKSIYLARQPLL